MTGRHRKVKTSTSTRAAAKIAITGAFLGSGGATLAGQAGAATDGQWDEVSRCESGGNWTSDSGNGFQGGLQFAPVTWSAYERVPAGQGRGAWPACGGPLADTAPRQVPSEPPAPEAEPTAAQADVIGTTPPSEDSPPGPPPADVAEPQAPPAPDAVLLPPLTESESAAPAADPEAEAQLWQASATVPASDSEREATLMALIHRYSGTRYIWGGDTPEGTDCSGLASWLANAATGRPTFGDRFDTSTEESALLARGFRRGTAPGALVIGWNDHHTAVTLADGTPVASGEGGGIRIGGGGAYQAQFDHHMYLPMAPELVDGPPVAPDTVPVVDGALTPPPPSPIGQA